MRVQLNYYYLIIKKSDESEELMPEANENLSRPLRMAAISRFRFI
jgi:hypothetical protein